MNTRKIYLNDVVRQLLILDYEITLLKFRVEEAVPEVMRECYGQVRRLLEQHQALEVQVKHLEEMPDDTWTDHCMEIDCALAELLELFVSARTRINMRLSEPVRSRAFSEEIDALPRFEIRATDEQENRRISWPRRKNILIRSKRNFPNSMRN